MWKSQIMPPQLGQRVAQIHNSQCVSMQRAIGVDVGERSKHISCLLHIWQRFLVLTNHGESVGESEVQDCFSGWVYRCSWTVAKDTTNNLDGGRVKIDVVIRQQRLDSFHHLYVKPGQSSQSRQGGSSCFYGKMRTIAQQRLKLSASDMRPAVGCVN
jgi:hypothetical protein